MVARGLPDDVRPGPRPDVRQGVRRASSTGGRGARRVRGLPRVVRGEPRVNATPVTLARALNLGLRRSLEDDERVVLMGEDIGKLGGVFRVTDSLQKDFGEQRVIDTPLAESGIVGTAVGLAMRGY